MLSLTNVKGSELISVFNQVLEKEHITGFINAENPELNVTSKIFIENAQIVYATSTMYHSRFGDLMIKKGIITPKELNSALKIQKEDPEKPLIGHILIEMGVISERVIPNLLYHQIELVIYEILAWKTANIKFEEYDIAEHPEYKSPITRDETKGLHSDLNKLSDSKSYISHLLLNINEIVKIRQHINNPDIIPVRINKDYPSQLSFDQRKILRAIDGSNSLNDIIILSDLNYFRTYQILYNLAKEQIIEIKGVSFEKNAEKEAIEKNLTQNNVLINENIKLKQKIEELNEKLQKYESIISHDVVSKVSGLSDSKKSVINKLMNNILELSS